MFERFTEQARFAVTDARDQAKSLGHPYIGTEHILLGLLDPRSGGSATLLRGAGLTPERVYADMQRLVSPLPGVFSPQDVAALEAIGIDLDIVLARIEETFGPLAAAQHCGRNWFGRRRHPAIDGRPWWSPRSKKVLELSLREALRCEDKSIATEHLLLGILRGGEGLAMQIITDAGVDVAELSRRAESVLRRAA